MAGHAVACTNLDDEVATCPICMLRDAALGAAAAGIRSEVFMRVVLRLVNESWDEEILMSTTEYDAGAVH